MINKYKLYGCKTAPASSYLKSIGLIKLLSKIDPTITAFWENDYFVIQTGRTQEKIYDYFLNEYEPTPVISPWSYNKYEKTKESLKSLLKSNKRFKTYEEIINQIEKSIFKKFKETIGQRAEKKSIDKNKTYLLKLCRNMMPEEYIPWLDVVYVLGTEKPSYAPLLGSGANDGNFDIAENFVKCLKLVLSASTIQKSKKWLESALFGGLPIELCSINTIGHNPDGSGGPNSGLGFEGKAMSNPWDYIIMIEGAMLFAGNVSKRLFGIQKKAVFPFTVAPSNVGYATASAYDTGEGSEPPSRGEMWFPIWSRPTTYREIEYVFKEGRMQIGGRHAKTGTEAARAVITLGTERGIDKFERYGILKRKGKLYLFVNYGTLHTEYAPMANLLDELDKWHFSITKTNKQSASLKRILRRYDDAIIKFCTTRDKRHMLDILSMVGMLERHISMLEGFKALPSMDKESSCRWLDECYDGSAEFRLAASVASILPSSGVEGVRTNLECAKVERGNWKHQKHLPSFVWKEGDILIRNMSRILQRRGIDGQKKSLRVLPIEGAIPARTGDIVKFLDGILDMKKIDGLILPLSCMTMYRGMNYPWKQHRFEGDDDVDMIPEAYMVMKLVCPPSEEDSIPYDMSMLQMLNSERIDAAYAKAVYMLQAHGYTPLSYNQRTKISPSTTVSKIVKKHLMAALLFPISLQTRNAMVKAVTNSSKIAHN